MNKIVFFGNERLVSGLDHTDTPALNALILAGYDVVAVVANDAGTKSRRQKTLEVAELAQAHGIPVHLPSRPMDIYDQLAAYGADAGVLVAYGRIVPQALIDLFPFGIINIHPSLLPKYRGPSPIESAVAAGDESTGISIMALSANMDAGPVYRQLEVPLTKAESAPELSHQLSVQAASELITALPQIFDGSLMPITQDESAATYCQLISKQDAQLRPDQQTAERAERLVRAYAAYPKARIDLLGHTIIVQKAHVVDSPTHESHIAFKDGTYLAIDQLVSPSGKSMTADAFVRGYKK